MKKQGFTLMEVLIVVAIIVILVAVGIPVFASQVEKAKTSACAANRRSVLLLVRMTAITKEITEDESFASLNTQYHLNDESREEYSCPKKGTYSWNNGQVLCSIHDNTGSQTPTGEQIQAGSYTITLKNDIKTEPEYVGGKFTLTPGDIYKIGDKYYVVSSKQSNLPKSEFPDCFKNLYNVAAIDFNEQLTESDLGEGGKMTNLGDVYTKMTPGSIYIYRGKAYVQSSSRTGLKKTSSSSPADNPTLWTELGTLS